MKTITRRRHRKNHLHHTYLGVTIWRNLEPGYRLRWSALGGHAADTLAGIKQSIRESQQFQKP